MSAPSGYPVASGVCECVWIGNGVLAKACPAHDAWRNASVAAEREACANTAVDWYEKETCGTLGADGLREAILNR